jgi:murein L,D-transpeptidase YcbB/YkuD
MRHTVTPNDGTESGGGGTATATPAKRKQVVKPKICHPAFVPDAEGKATVKLDAVPTDYDPKKHKPLSRANFNDETIAMAWQADDHERAAKRLRAEIEQLKTVGMVKNQTTAKKLVKIMSRLDEIKATLANEGVDVPQFLEALKAKAAASAVPAGV